jgi:cytochrome c biogenesis protein CcmG/thiol:disulfide interchange protein DsbE|tara:strand:- start:638 stop:1156 length:519 start_codon:yes stop_codon:yes gene_type:complete
MKKKKLVFFIIFITFCFLVFLKSLNKSNTYIPNKSSGKKISSFNSFLFFSNEEVNSDQIFSEDKIYLLNIWASWCAPCRAEHNILMELSKNPLIKIVGLNYKDDISNAKKFIDLLGNPYSTILVDKNGIISIELGAYGIPETFIINKKKIILKKYVGPLNYDSLKEIETLLK